MGKMCYVMALSGIVVSKSESKQRSVSEYDALTQHVHNYITDETSEYVHEVELAGLGYWVTH